MAGETGVGIGQRRRPKGTGSIQKLDAGRYRLRVFVGTDPVTGNPRQVTRAMPAKNETEARKTLVRLRDEVAAVEPSSSTATVRTLLEEWLAQSKARGRAPKTLHEARRSAETVIFPVLGDVPLRDLTARHLGEPYRTLTTGEGRAGPLKATSIRQHHAVLSAALGQAVRWGRREQNPSVRAQPPRVGLGQPAGADPLRGEGATGPGPGRERPVGDARRAGRPHQGAAGVELLGQWRHSCEDRAAAAGVELAADGFVVFPFPDASLPINPDSFSSAVHRMRGELGMAQVHLHSLRHFAATELLAGGIDARNAAEILGHANPSLTLGVYAHATAERQPVYRARRRAETTRPSSPPCPPVRMSPSLLPELDDQIHTCALGECNAAPWDGSSPAGGAIWSKEVTSLGLARRRCRRLGSEPGRRRGRRRR